MLLRRSQPGITRAFRTPLSPLIPILGIVACFSMMVSLDVLTWIRLAVWMAVGLVLYFLYGRHHARRVWDV